MSCVRSSHFGLATGFSVLVACLVVAAPTFATGATTSRVSISSTEGQGAGPSYYASISADGRYVAFTSKATNLVATDTNGRKDIFVRDRQLGTTELASITSAGLQGNGSSDFPSISGDGRYIAFLSRASNLVSGDTNGFEDIFVRDRQAGTTRRVSISSGEGQANSGSGGASSISANGRYVAFHSDATNLVANDTNHTWDIFVRDLQAGTTKRVSINSAGLEGNGSSAWSSISADGRYVAFGSNASNLVANDTNGTTDVFVRDRQAGTTKLISVSSAGGHGNDLSDGVSISADGRYVAFGSEAGNLVPNDTNGTWDTFVRDRQADTTKRVSISSAGLQGNASSGDHPSISADGRYIAFGSDADNLVANDTNDTPDVFVRDRQAGTTRRVSISSAGLQGSGSSYYPSISTDGRYIAFGSYANDLVANDTNGVRDIFVRGPLH